MKLGLFYCMAFESVARFDGHDNGMEVFTYVTLFEGGYDQHEAHNNPKTNNLACLYEPFWLQIGDEILWRTNVW
jgi:hypothetical protein